ncbi:hypothetical protein CERZMDRAFT_86284 [Cercospora zeae-maydis SCOH1-5]|uniref:Uncharacterized protein n=1 Tax=Cercospora zeae-maydis SCOH1-5 TaxID=717836 RepID=A0A6A6FA03_9PEZI|nr:hypothetical protein CERZMDRAFT_86284 [Cercospora zeae-maydis SCOH1-5]
MTVRFDPNLRKQVPVINNEASLHPVPSTTFGMGGLSKEAGKSRANTGRLERQMGFRASRIFCRTWEDGPFVALRHEVDPIIEQVSETLESPEVDIGAGAKLRIEGAFDKLAPSLWPSADVDRTAWLVIATSNDWDGLYPRDLYHDQETDLEILRAYFVAWLAEKCRVRARNLQHGLVKPKYGTDVVAASRPVKRAIRHIFRKDTDYEPPGSSRKRARESNSGAVAGVTPSAEDTMSIASEQIDKDPRDSLIVVLNLDPAGLALIAAVYDDSHDDASSLNSFALERTTPKTTLHEAIVPGEQACAVNRSSNPDVENSEVSEVPSMGSSSVSHLDTSGKGTTMGGIHGQDESSSHAEQSALFNASCSISARQRRGQPGKEQQRSERDRARDVRPDTELRSRPAILSIERPIELSRSQERPVEGPVPRSEPRHIAEQRDTAPSFVQSDSSVEHLDSLTRASLRINWNPPTC